MWDSFEQPKGLYSARFNWVTSLAIKDTVLYYAEKSEFEKTGKYSHRIVGTNKTVDVSNNEIYDGTDNISLAPVQSHKVETHTLTADTEYVWVVGNGKHNVYTGSFKTPAANVNDFEFIWISDAQTNGSSLQSTINNYNERAKKAIDLAVSEYPDAAFILSTGDQVNYTFDTWEWDAFFSTNQKVFEKYPLYLMPGNHEYNGYPLFTRNSETIDPSMSTLKGRFNAPKNGAAHYGGGNNGTEPLVNGLDKVRLDGNNYYFIYGDTLFMVMENVDTDEAIAEQVAWMKSVVKNNPTKWRVASLHISLFPGYRDQPANFQQWTDGMDAAGVDLVLMGHEHIYLRTKLMNDGIAIADQQAYGEGTTYITNSPATNAMGYFYSPRDYTEVAFDEFGSSFAGISITPDEIRITAKGYDSKNGDVLTVEDDNTLITNKPRTPNLSSYEFPSAVEFVPAEIYEASIGGVAKEDQSLLALTKPRGASASYQWQISADGKTDWTDIPGADKVRFSPSEAEVGSYLRVVVTGIEDFGGTVISPATKKVIPLRSDGVNDPGYTLDLSTVHNGGLPAGWVVDNNATVGVATTPDGEKAVKVVNSEDFVVDIPFGPQRQVFDISYSLYVETNGTYPEWNDRYYSTKLSFLDSLGEPVAWNQPMTWGDTGGQFYWNGSGGFLGFKTKAGTEEDSSNGNFVFTDNATAGKWFTFVYSFDFTQGTYTVTVNGEPVYVSPSLASDTFIIPPASSEITSMRLESGLSGGSNNHLSESVYYYKDIVVGDGGLVDEPKEVKKIYDYKNYKTGKLMIHDSSVSVSLDAASIIKNGVVFTGEYAEFRGEGFANTTVEIKPKKDAATVIDFKGTKVKEVIIEGSNVEIRGDENVQVITYGKKSKKK